jgi:hydrogenase nickel incorporation protein HypA/HybF
MHELSIAQALIEQVQREMRRAGHKGRVARLELAVGRLSGVHCDSLRFAFELIAPGTPVEGAELSISEPRAVCCCRSCGAREEIDELVVECPRCHAHEISIEEGRDLLLESIEIEEPVKDHETT